MRQMKAIATHDTCDVLQDIKAPTLVITGDSDVAIPPGNSDVLTQKIPGAQLATIKDGAHGFSFSHADKTAEALINFLG